MLTSNTFDGDFGIIYNSSSASRVDSTLVTVGLHRASLDDVAAVAHGARVEIGDEALACTLHAHDMLTAILDSGRSVYGLTTGVGDLYSVRLTRAEISQAQFNILLSHASGIGQPHDIPSVRAIMFAMLRALVQGKSGVSPRLVKTIAAMLNRGVTPWSPSQGSVGYLIATAHIGLVIFGSGRAWYEGELLSGAEAMERAGIEISPPGPREGHALVSGTYEITGIGALAVEQSRKMVEVADIVGALSVEALRGNTRGYDRRLQQLRPHPGQLVTADRMLDLLAGSQILADSIDDRLQDPLSTRCIPQVHGAVRDCIEFCARILETELNSVTDNPVFVEEEDNLVALHGGNGHGAPAALSLDYLAIAIAELSTISQARSDRLTNSHVNGLPPFLTNGSGSNSGFMIPPYAAAAIAAENRALAAPASVHTVSTCANQEDHVSMGVTSAMKARTSASNCAMILAVELLCACQALEFRRPLTPGVGTTAAYRRVREIIPAWISDREMYVDIEHAISLVDSDALTNYVADALRENRIEDL